MVDQAIHAGLLGHVRPELDTDLALASRARASAPGVQCGGIKPRTANFTSDPPRPPRGHVAVCATAAERPTDDYSPGRLLPRAWVLQGRLGRWCWRGRGVRSAGSTWLRMFDHLQHQGTLRRADFPGQERDPRTSGLASASGLSSSSSCHWGPSWLKYRAARERSGPGGRHPLHGHRVDRALPQVWRDRGPTARSPCSLPSAYTAGPRA